MTAVRGSPLTLGEAARRLAAVPHDKAPGEDVAQL